VSVPSARAATASDPTTLERRLGPIDAAAIVVSNVIGGGIFFVPILVARQVPSGWAMLGVWILGGALAFAGAMAYAELATLRPRAGGEYVYLREAYGRPAAFLTGWTSFVAGFSGAIAASSVAFADYVGRFAPVAADRTPILTLPLPGAPIVVTPQALVAIAVIVALSFVHVHALGRVVHNLLTSVKVLAIAVFCAIGLMFGAGATANLSRAQAVVSPSTGWMLALVPVMFTYSGWNAAAYVAEEIRNPTRNIPIALGVGTVAVVGIYLLLNVVYLYGMPVADLATLEGRLTDSVADRLFGFVAGDLLGAFTIVSLAASISAMVWAGPRVYYAMSRDGAFLRSAQRVHSQHRTPVVAIGAQAVWSSVLVLSGTLSQLVEYTGFGVVLFSAIAVLALFVLRIREPHAVRPFRAWGYPLAPAFFVVTSMLMVGYQIWNSPATSGAGLGVIAAGIPTYWLFVRAARSSTGAVKM
jgi:APA family basic amino acid/polyamine antiporter